MKKVDKEYLLKMFYKACKYACSEEQNDQSIQKGNQLIDKLIFLLPFQNQEQKERYLDLLFTYKYWEEWERETIKIINQLY